MGMTDEISVSCHSRVSVLACIGNYSADDLQEALFHNFQAFQILKHRSRKETLWPAPQSISIQSLLVRHVFCELGPASCCLPTCWGRAQCTAVFIDRCRKHPRRRHWGLYWTHLLCAGVSFMLMFEEQVLAG